MKIYVAGPMTGLPNLNFPLFHAETARLRALGFVVVNPAEINADPTSDWLACMRADIRELVTCDAIALLPGWETSRGAGIEHGLARALGLQVYEAGHVVGLSGELVVVYGKAISEVGAAA